MPTITTIVVDGQAVEGLYCTRCRTTVAPVSSWPTHEEYHTTLDERIRGYAGGLRGRLVKPGRNHGGVEKLASIDMRRSGGRGSASRRRMG